MFWIIEEITRPIGGSKIQPYFFQFLDLIENEDGLGLLQLDQELSANERLYSAVWKVLTSAQKQRIRQLMRDEVLND